MSFNKVLVRDGAMFREAVSGDGRIGDYLRPVTVATAGNLTITVDAILGGAAIFTGAAGAVAYTTPTGAQLDAAHPKLGIGDSFVFSLTNTAAQAATITGGTGVTVSGLSVANAATRHCIMTKTGVATYTCQCI
jgi:hypothetical protein